MRGRQQPILVSWLKIEPWSRFLPAIEAMPWLLLLSLQKDFSAFFYTIFTFLHWLNFLTHINDTKKWTLLKFLYFNFLSLRTLRNIVSLLFDYFIRLIVNPSSLSNQFLKLLFFISLEYEFPKLLFALFYFLKYFSVSLHYFLNNFSKFRVADSISYPVSSIFLFTFLVFISRLCRTEIILSA